MKRITVCISILLAFVFAACTGSAAAVFAADTPQMYVEAFYWDKAGEDADNGYAAYDVPWGGALVIPPQPERDGYVFLGWKDWNTDQIVDLQTQTMNAKGRSFYAAWQKQTYVFRFFADGKVWTTVTSEAGEAFIHPRTPSKDGYMFSGWEPALPDITPAQDMDFAAVFKPHRYKATLLVDGKVYKELEYIFGQKSLSLPDVPKKAGYIGAWEPYSLGIGGVTIRAIYTADPAQKIVSGDADGDGTVSLKDVALMQRSLVDTIGGSAVHTANADVNADGRFDLRDVVLLRRYLAGGWGVTLL